MQSLRPLINRKFNTIVAAFGVLLSLALPAALPFTVYAGSITSRSIGMTSSAADASGVTYNLSATLQTGLAASGGLIIEFCSDSPLIGLSCTHPAGFTVASVATTGSTTAGTASDFDNTGAHSTIKWVATGAVTAGSTVGITFTGIHNPTAVGTFYARITSYDTSAHLSTYSNATTLGTYADSGGIAMSTTNNIGVTAYVRESMTFCVAGASPIPTANCGGSLSTPSMTLGQDIGGGALALDPTAVSTGTDYAQLSTNAAGGAVVNLHTSTTGCGGLVRGGATANCDITAQNAGASTITAGQAKFGVKAGPAAAAPSATATGSLGLAGSYSNGNYFLDYVVGDATGVTSPYGSAFFNSGGAPVSNMNMPFTFGVSAANTTPAGIYSATLNLVATGTF